MAIVLTLFRNVYLHHFPLRFSWLSVIVGVVGFLLWIGIAALGVERWVAETFAPWMIPPGRPSFNPFAQIPDGTTRTIFMAVRFTLLAALVPIAEELFVRGRLTRWMEDVDWPTVSLTLLSMVALATPTVYGMATHVEVLAALVWFSLVTWLMVRTGNFWDCVVAHMTTNLLLGIYVVIFSQWQLW